MQGTMSALAQAYKKEGNSFFQAKNFVAAESLYSKAIIEEPNNPVLYTNRAMARMELGFTDNAIADCEECISLDSENMKAHYQLSRAYFKNHEYDEAVKYAGRAQKLCVQTADKSLRDVTAQLRKCRASAWAAKERARPREAGELEAYLVGLVDIEHGVALDAELTPLSCDEVNTEFASKTAMLRDVFDRARRDEERARVPPEWLFDEITFEPMVDPVITKSGKSYERASIEEYLRVNPVDPITREPFNISDLVPNHSLREACEDFCEKNGWVYDY